MGFSIDSTPQIIENSPTELEGPEGSEMLFLWTIYPAYDELADGDTVYTTQIDFVTFLWISPDTLKAAMEQVMPMAAQAGEEIVQYALFGGLTQDVTLPEQVCLGSACVPVPFGGSTIATMNVYRLWILSRPVRSAAALAYRPFPLPVVVAVLGVIGTLFFVAGYISALIGEKRWTVPSAPTTPPTWWPSNPPPPGSPAPPAGSPRTGSTGGSEGYGGQQADNGWMLAAGVGLLATGAWILLATQQSERSVE